MFQSRQLTQTVKALLNTAVGPPSVAGITSPITDDGLHGDVVIDEQTIDT